MSTNLLGRIVARSVSLGLTVGVSIAIGVIVAAPARAATLVGTPSDATGINGLVVDSITYNVTFINGSFDAVYSSSTPTFLGNISGAADAAIALQAVFISLGVMELTGQSTIESVLLVPDGHPISVANAGWFVHCEGSVPCVLSLWAANPYTAVGDDVVGLDYALFTPAATPLPAALPLFGTALGVGGLLGWRRQRKTAAAAIPAS